MGVDSEDVGGVKLAQTTWVKSWRDTQSRTVLTLENRCAGRLESAVAQELVLTTTTLLGSDSRLSRIIGRNEVVLDTLPGSRYSNSSHLFSMSRQETP